MLSRPTRRASLLLALMATAWSSAAAQVPVAASEGHAVTSQAQAAGMSPGQSASFSGEVAAGTAYLELSASSANYSFEGGLLGCRGALADLPPLLSGVAQGAQGVASGGESVALFGVNFDQAAPGSLAASFGGAAASGLQLLSANRLTALTPPGLNLHGNPLGAADVALSSDLGSSTRTEAFDYLPALVLDQRAHDNGVMALRYKGEPGWMFLALGGSVPGAAQKLQPFEGKLELVVNPLFLLNFIPVGFGEVPLVLPLVDVPQLIGLTFEWQALQATSLNPKAGGWTNVLRVTVEA